MEDLRWHYFLGGHCTLSKFQACAYINRPSSHKPRLQGDEKGGHRITETSATLLRALDTIRQQQERIHIHSITIIIHVYSYVQENITTSERTSAVTKTMNCVCVCVCVCVCEGDK